MTPKPDPESTEQAGAISQTKITSNENRFKTRLLLQHAGRTRGLLSDIKDILTLHPHKFAGATAGGRGFGMKDEYFSPSQIVSFVVHGALALLILLSVTGKLPIAKNIGAKIPGIFAPDPAELRKLAVMPEPSHGGGGGGDRDIRPPTTGVLPPFAHEQIVAPSVHIFTQSVLVVPPTLLGAEQARVPNADLPNWGDPKALARTNSGGPGCCQGIGPGDGTGIGPSKGSGYDQGDLEGTGGDRFVAGTAKGVRPPECLYCPRPEYSDEARVNHYQGSVLLNVVVLANGKAGRIEVIQTPGMGLDEKAIEAVRNWHFKAAVGPDGKAISVLVPVEVVFQLF